MFGYPGSIRTDGGPQFRAEFSEWCSQRGIIHELSSPYHPQSNGHAEAAVKNVKQLIEKCNGYNDNFTIALSQYRLYPRAAQPESPAQLFLGRQPRSVFLPQLADTPMEATANHSVATKYRILQPGDKVLVRQPHTKRWDQEGVIITARDDRQRSYQVQVGLKSYIRNRRHLKPLKATGRPGHDDTDQTSSSPPSATPPSEGTQTVCKNKDNGVSKTTLPRRSPRLRNASVSNKDL